MRRATGSPCIIWSNIFLFLSTLSLRRATRPSSGTKRRFRYFYPRSPCGERLAYRVQLGSMVSISIHALLAESDCRHNSLPPFAILFLSTLSLRRATAGRIRFASMAKFLSTLSLRRATRILCKRCARPLYFYPRSPCGERPDCKQSAGFGIVDFYPRSPCGERRFPVSAHRFDGRISIHALLAESDFTTLPVLLCLLKFLSTLSLRRATACP